MGGGEWPWGTTGGCCWEGWPGHSPQLGHRRLGSQGRGVLGPHLVHLPRLAAQPLAVLQNEQRLLCRVQARKTPAYGLVAAVRLICWIRCGLGSKD